MNVADNAVTQPMPKDNPVSETYWAGLKQGVFRIQQCGACCTLRHYPRLLCPECHSMDVRWIDASGKAKVHSWSVAHHAFHPGFAGEVPYVMVAADLDEGVRALGRLVDAQAAQLRIGMPLQLVIEARADGLPLPCFRPT